MCPVLCAKAKQNAKSPEDVPADMTICDSHSHLSKGNLYHLSCSDLFWHGTYPDHLLGGQWQCDLINCLGMRDILSRPIRATVVDHTACLVMWPGRS